MTRNRKSTATDQAFAEYKSYIVTQLLDFQRSLSYATAESLANWQSTLPYDEATMESLIKASITFISTLNNYSSQDPCFLQALTIKIANHLSNYKAKGNPRIKSGEQLSEKSLNTILTESKETLQNQLQNCKYMTLLRAKLATQREMRKINHYQKKQDKKRRNYEAAQQSYSIARQIRAEFTAAQNTPRNR